MWSCKLSLSSLVDPGRAQPSETELQSSCHCSPLWHFRIWQTWCRLGGLVPPVAPQATTQMGEISSLRPGKPRLPVAWPMTRLSVSQTSRCPANCRSNLNLCQSVQLATSLLCCHVTVESSGHPAIAAAPPRLYNLLQHAPQLASSYNMSVHLATSYNMHHNIQCLIASTLEILAI